MSEPLIELRVARKNYDAELLSGIDLVVEPGQRVALLGPSGCGKTTLLNIVAGLDLAYSGCRLMSPGARIGYLFQEPRLLPWRTVRQNLKLVGAHDSHIDHLLAEIGLSDSADLFPRQLSLGMARRVALARALAIGPDLLLLDEPLVSLDPETAEAMRDLLLGIVSSRPAMGLLLVSHDLVDVERLVQEVLLLGRGAGGVLARLNAGDRNFRAQLAAAKSTRATEAGAQPEPQPGITTK